MKTIMFSQSFQKAFRGMNVLGCHGFEKFWNGVNEEMNEDLKREPLIKEAEKCFDEATLKKARKFCLKHKIDYYQYLCMGCDNNLLVDSILREMGQFPIPRKIL